MLPGGCVMWLVFTMLAALSLEVPYITEDRATEHRESVYELARINREVAESDAEAAVLASIQYFEGRYRVRPKDGDCRPFWNGSAWARRCGAFGPMQISVAAPRWLVRMDSKWKGITVKELRDPRRHVEAAQEILNSWRKKCGGKSYGVWITAYGWGRCPTKGYVDWEGSRRCALATAILEAGNRVPEGWKCGHEGRSQTRRTRAVVARVADANPNP